MLSARSFFIHAVRTCAVALSLLPMHSVSLAQNTLPSVSGLVVGVAPAPSWVQWGTPPAAAVVSEIGRSMAVIQEWHQTQWRWQPKASTEHFEHRIFRVQKSEGLQELGSMRIPYVSDFQQLTLHRLRIQRQGQWIDVLSQTTFKVSQVQADLERFMLTGRVVALGQIQDLRVDDRLELAYTISGHNPVFGDQLSAQIPWNNPYLTLKRSVRVLHPVSVNVQAKLKGYVNQGAKEQQSQQADWTERNWSGEDVWPYLVESQMPATLSPLVLLQLSSFGDWAAVRRWGTQLFNQPGSADPAIVQEAQRLRALGAQPEQWADQAIRFVQNEIRYFSVSVQENTHRPQLPQVTLQRRFGDCKDKSALLVALLNELGVRAYPVLVSQQERQMVNTNLPGPYAFDHVVVLYRLGGKDHWVDATMRMEGVPVAKQSNTVLGSRGLVLDESSADLTPTGTVAAQVISNIQEEFQVESLDGPVKVRSTTLMQERMAEALRQQIRQRGDINFRQGILNAASQRYEAATAVSGFPKWSDNLTQNQLLLQESYTVPKFFTRDSARNVWLVRLGASQLLGAIGSVPSGTQRIWPVALAMPYTIHIYRAKVQMPSHIQGREDPVSDSMDTPFFSLRTQRSFRGSEFIFELRLAVLVEAVTREQLPQLQKDMEVARKKILDIVVIDPDRMVGASDSKESEARRVEKAQRDIIANTTRVIEAKRLAPSDMVGVYVERGNARLVLGEFSGAMEDARAALAINANAEAALVLRAGAYVEERQLGLAEADLTRALALSEASDQIYLKRGQIRYMQKRWSQAIEDFTQAQKASRHGENAGFIQIWLMLSRMHMGQPIAIQGAFVQDWPGPIQQLMAGKITEAELLARAHKDSAIETQSNLCEAYFYIALWHGAQGRQTQYLNSLRQTLGTGVIQYLEYGWARWLLNQPVAKAP